MSRQSRACCSLSLHPISSSGPNPHPQALSGHLPYTGRTRASLPNVLVSSQASFFFCHVKKMKLKHKTRKNNNNNNKKGLLRSDSTQDQPSTPALVPHWCPEPCVRCLLPSPLLLRQSSHLLSLANPHCTAGVLKNEREKTTKLCTGSGRQYNFSGTKLSQPRVYSPKSLHAC